jgi:hypothetical protein
LAPGPALRRHQAVFGRRAATVSAHTTVRLLLIRTRVAQAMAST